MNIFKALKNRTPLGWLQLSHDRARLITAISGIAFADILIFAQMGFLNALFDSSVMLHESLNADLVLMNPQGLNITDISTFPRTRLYQAMNIPGVVSAQEVYINSVRWKNPQTAQKSSIMVIGIGIENTTLNLPEVNQNLEQIKLPYHFLFDRASRGKYQEVIANFEQGKNITTEIERNTITISGLFNLGASFGADATLISSQENFLRLFPKKSPSTVSLGLLKVSGDVEQIKEQLNTYLAPFPDVEVMTKEEFMNKEKNYWGTNRPVGVIFGFGITIGFIVGVVIVYQVLATDVNDHLAEYATFKAMGYDNRYLLSIVFEEAIILALFGFLPGLGISFGFYTLARNATALPLYITFTRALGVLVATFIMCLVSGWIATKKLQSADPADIF